MSHPSFHTPVEGKVRVRFAPSPTGHLHVGGARTALYNYLFAQHHGGEFILRVEDTDLERSTEESMRLQIQDLKWLNIPWVEGPNPDTLVDHGPHGPYRQSRRKEIYQEHADRLLADGRAYYDFRTDEELEVVKQAKLAKGLPAQMDPPENIVPLAEARRRIAAGEKAAVRFRVTEKRDYVLHDMVRGDVTFPSDMIGDFVCIRSNGMPVYNFCCTVDDALMQITHVFRAEEHLSNTLRQMILYDAFGYKLPRFGHLSFILGPDKQKLSKRHGATSCDDYKRRGYLPEALDNFILLSGWSSPSGAEILSREAQIAEFTADRFQTSAAVFDSTKLEWMNSQYLRALSHEDLWQRIQPFIKDLNLPMAADSEWRDHALAAFKVKMTTLADAHALLLPLDDSKFTITAEAKEVFEWPESKRVWTTWKQALMAHPGERFTEEEFAALEAQVKTGAQVKGKTLFQPIRVAIIGQPHGTELKSLVPLMTKSSLLTRVERCLNF